MKRGGSNMTSRPGATVPKGVPVAPGAYLDARGKVWLVEESRFGLRYRLPDGLLITKGHPAWETILKNTGALPFRRMAPIRRKI